MIAILLGLLMPAMARVREAARTTQCLSQLRQVGIAIFNYAANNSGQTPNFSTRHEYPVDLPDDGSNSGPGWVVLLERYIGQKPDGAIWSCPAWPDDQRRINYFIAAKWMWRGQSPGQRSIQLSKIRTASEFVLSGDCTAQEYYPPPYGNDETDGKEDIDKDDNAIECLRFSTHALGGYNTHRVGNNVLFADGHAATMKKFDPDLMTCSPLEPHVTWDEVQLPQ